MDSKINTAGYSYSQLARGKLQLTAWDMEAGLSGSTPWIALGR